MMGDRPRTVVLGKRSDGARLRVHDSRLAISKTFAMLGAAFAFVGVVDLGLLWTPTNFAAPMWEFRVLTRTLNSLPMPMLGLGLLAYGFLKHPGRSGRGVRVVAVFFLGLAVALFLAGAMYATALPAVVADAGAGGSAEVLRAAIRSGAEWLAYTAVSTAAGIGLWRTVRRERVDE